jgi:hypothetical protein
VGGESGKAHRRPHGVETAPCRDPQGTAKASLAYRKIYLLSTFFNQGWLGPGFGIEPKSVLRRRYGVSPLQTSTPSLRNQTSDLLDPLGRPVRAPRQLPRVARRAAPDVFGPLSGKVGKPLKMMALCRPPPRCGYCLTPRGWALGGNVRRRRAQLSDAPPQFYKKTIISAATVSAGSVRKRKRCRRRAIRQNCWQHVYPAFFDRPFASLADGAATTF